MANKNSSELPELEFDDEPVAEKATSPVTSDSLGDLDFDEEQVANQTAPSFMDRMEANIDERGSKVGGLAYEMLNPSNPLQSDKTIGLPSFLLQTGGQVAGTAIDLVGEGLVSAMNYAAESFPEQAKALRGGMAALMSIKVPFQSGATKYSQRVVSEAVSGFSTAADELEKEHPKQAGEIRAAANMLMALSPSKATKTSSLSKVRASKRAFVDELILDNSTPSKAKKFVTRAEQTSKKATDFKIKLTPTERKISMEVRKIKGVNPKKTYLQNLNLIQDETNTILRAVEKRLAKSTARINLEGADRLIDAGVIKVISKNPLVDMASKKQMKDFVDLGKRILRDHPNTPSGMLAARRDFDKFAQVQKANVFQTPMERPINDIVLNVRRTMNNIIDAAAPTAGVKKSLSRSSRLITAQEAIAPKAYYQMTTRKPGIIERTAGTVANVAERHAIYQLMRSGKVVGK